MSFDDGDHWQSLRLDMPAISVRDIQVKDDASCLCSDLVAGTHGRGFWILDDVTPLRQAAAMRAAASAGRAYLFKPAPAVRVRFGTNDPTPWPPELPAGENPPPGAIIDYYLAGDATAPVKLEILDGAGKVVRTYSSNDPVRTPDPALDPAAYNKLCQQTPSAADCGLPLYWPAPQMVIGTRAGHASLQLGSALRSDRRRRRTRRRRRRARCRIAPIRRVNAPWAPPGTYTVRLTVDGKSYTQPLALHLDPRVKTPPAALTQLTSLTREMYDGARAAHDAAEQARALQSRTRRGARR